MSCHTENDLMLVFNGIGDPPPHHHQIDINNKVECTGFLFAFYKFSHLSNATFIERMVRMATASDTIHVAILPVPRCVLTNNAMGGNSNIGNNCDQISIENIFDVHGLEVEDTTYSSFIGAGFLKQNASTVLNDKYEFLFVPVEPQKYLSGLNFLNSLDGTKYNYWALPLTVLPNSLKPQINNNSSQDNDKNNHPSRVFCSQVGLMLCYKCEVLNPHGMAPACCAPGELSEILKSRAGGLPCERNLISVLISPDSRQ
jgi:hypothetical protein